MIANLAARIALTIIREQQTELTRLREALRPFAAAAVSAGEACGNSAPVSLMPDCPLFCGRSSESSRRPQ